MLEKYLGERGLTLADIATNYPDLADLVQKYSIISQMKGDEFKGATDEIGREIIDKISEKGLGQTTTTEIPVSTSSVINMESAPSTETTSDIEIPQSMEIPDLGGVLEEIENTEVSTRGDKEPIGYLFKGVNFSEDGFMKVLSFLGMDYRWKQNGNKRIWSKDENHIISEPTLGYSSEGDPFKEKVDLTVIGDNKNEISRVLRSKIATYDSKLDIYDEPNLEGSTEGVTSDTNEPVTGIPYKDVDDTIKDLYKIESVPELLTLLELSTGKKYACGCGHL